MLNKTRIITLLLLAFGISTYAQSNFKEGYVITHDNDTINGLINFRDDRSNMLVCHFKQSENASEELYSPSDISSYRLINEGKYYVSHEVTINNRSQKIFLEFLVKGMMNLYFYKGAQSLDDYDRFFFENEEGKLREVSRKYSYTEQIDGKSDTRYKGMLTYIFADQPLLRTQINNSSYDRQSMTKLVKNYHALTCSTGEDCIEFSSNNKEFIQAKVTVYAGFQTAKYSMKYGNNREPSMNSFKPVLGGRVNLSDPRISKAMSVNLDVSMSGVKGEMDDYRYPSLTSKYSALQLALKLGPQYKFTFGKWQPVLGAGYGLLVLTNSTNKLTHKDSGKLYDEFTDNYLFSGFNFNTGLDYVLPNKKTISFRCTYEIYSELSVAENAPKHKLNILQFNLGYTF